jgi:hypothetical protein
VDWELKKKPTKDRNETEAKYCVGNFFFYSFSGMKSLHKMNNKTKRKDLSGIFFYYLLIDGKTGGCVAAVRRFLLQKKKKNSCTCT